MKRRWTSILVLVLLGAMANVAVAWGCALWSPLGESKVVGKAGAQVRGGRMIAADYVAVFRREGLGLVSTKLQWHVPAESNAIWVYQAGWPLSSMSGRMDNDGSVTGAAAAPPWLRARTQAGFGRPVPLVPLWPGFLANTIVAAFVLYLVTLAPIRLRRHIRRRRDRCPSCGYDLSGADHERCPECGADARR